MILWEGQPEKFSYVIALWPRACVGLFVILFTLFWLYLLSHTPARNLPNKGFGRYIYCLLPYFSIAGFLLGSWLCCAEFVRRFCIWPTVRYSVTEKAVQIEEKGRTIEISLTEVLEIITFHSRIGRPRNVGTICFKRSKADILPVGMNALISRKSVPVAPAFVAIPDVDCVATTIRNAINLCENRKERD